MKLFLIIFFLFNASLLYSQDSIDEIIVKAELTDNSLYRLPLSVTVINEEDIINRNAQHIEDILFAIPNINYATGSSRGKFLQIRGIGERSEFTEPVNYSVGVIIDGIDFTGISLAASTFDVEQIEVLRGPQGTIYGANALAGLINIVSNSPETKLYSELSGSLSEFDGRSLGFVFSGPLNEKSGFRFSLKKNESDGFIKNKFLGTDETNNIDEFVSRFKIHFDSDDESLKINLIFSDADNGYDAFSLDNNRVTLSDEPGHDRQETFAGSIKYLKEFNNINSEFLISFADSDLEYGYDEDWSNIDICNQTPCDTKLFGFDWWYSSFDNYIRDNENISIDARFLSKTINDWVVGLYYRNQKTNLIREYTYLENDFKSSFETENIAIYGQYKYPLSNSIDVETGLRFETRDSDYIDNNGPAPSDFVCIAIYPKPESCLFNNEYKNSEDFWGGKIVFKNQVNNNLLRYLLISKGYKPGGVNIAGNLSSENLKYDSETMINYELGFKGNLNQNLLFQIALFYQDREDVQTKQSIVTSIESGLQGGLCPCSFTDYIGNAVKGSNYGIELELLWLISNKADLFFNLGLLETEFENYLSYSHVDSDLKNGIPVNLTGRDQSHAPQYQLNFGLNYRITENLNIKFDIEAKDEFYFSDRHNIHSDDYVLLNVVLGYQKNSWEVNLFGKNLTDEDYQTRGFGSFGNDPRKFYDTEPYYQYGAPRVVGINGKRKF